MERLKQIRNCCLLPYLGFEILAEARSSGKACWLSVLTDTHGIALIFEDGSDNNGYDGMTLTLTDFTVL